MNKQDFRKWASKQMSWKPDSERTLWPLWARLLFWIAVVSLCGLIWTGVLNPLP